MVLALVLAEIAVGGLAVLWLTPLWGRVRESFYKVNGAVLAAFAILAFLAARGPLSDAGEGAAALALLGAFAVATVVWQVVVWLRAPGVVRVVGIAVVPVGVAALIAMALVPAARNGAPLAAFQLLAGALFAGAVVDGLLLGHWHLVDRKLSREYLGRINLFFLSGTALAALAVLLGGTGGGEARPDFSPLLGVGVLTVSLAVGLAALCAVMALFIRALIKENSLQAATGFFYLAVILALASEFAAKVRFF
jgi:hypothetical protein